MNDTQNNDAFEAEQNHDTDVNINPVEEFLQNVDAPVVQNSQANDNEVSQEKLENSTTDEKIQDAFIQQNQTEHVENVEREYAVFFNEKKPVQQPIYSNVNAYNQNGYFVDPNNNYSYNNYGYNDVNKNYQQFGQQGQGYNVNSQQYQYVNPNVSYQQNQPQPPIFIPPIYIPPIYTQQNPQAYQPQPQLQPQNPYYQQPQQNPYYQQQQQPQQQYSYAQQPPQPQQQQQYYHNNYMNNQTAYQKPSQPQNQPINNQLYQQAMQPMGNADNAVPKKKKWPMWITITSVAIIFMVLVIAGGIKLVQMVNQGESIIGKYDLDNGTSSGSTYHYPNGVSSSELKKIKNGMSYAHVSKIIGGDGTLTDNGTSPLGQEYFTYTWIGESQPDTYVYITFQNDAVSDIISSGV